MDRHDVFDGTARGSDVGLLRTARWRAVTARIRLSAKIFISAGDHDLVDNILHLVLARLPDARLERGYRFPRSEAAVARRYERRA
jgi:hypothetical protein